MSTRKPVKKVIRKKPGKPMTDAQKLALTELVSKEIAELAERRGCTVDVVVGVMSEGKFVPGPIAAGLRVSVKD